MASNKDLVSVILPAFNEEQIISANLSKVHAFLRSRTDQYDWEIIVVNDGSSDRTGSLVEEFAGKHEDQVTVVHHHRNMGLGSATKTGVLASRGNKLVILDIDLSYDVHHIDRLYNTLCDSGADVVLASPYMKGGEINNVPPVRRYLSVLANKFLALVAHGKLSTLTCMVRGFDGDFIRSLVLRSTGMDVMPETIYKSMIMRGNIVEIPATLDWGLQAKATGRTSSMRIFRQIVGTLLSGFLFRPFMFFIVPGLILLVFSMWVNIWMIVHFFDALQAVPSGVETDSISWAIAQAYQDYPHTFIVGLLSLMVAIQLISLGILALQSKSYFEEVFYLGSTMKQRGATRNSVD